MVTGFGHGWIRAYSSWRNWPSSSPWALASTSRRRILLGTGNRQFGHALPQVLLGAHRLPGRSRPWRRRRCVSPRPWPFPWLLRRSAARASRPGSTISLDLSLPSRITSAERFAASSWSCLPRSAAARPSAICFWRVVHGLLQRRPHVLHRDPDENREPDGLADQRRVDVHANLLKLLSCGGLHRQRSRAAGEPAEIPI